MRLTNPTTRRWRTPQRLLTIGLAVTVMLIVGPARGFAVEPPPEPGEDPRPGTPRHCLANSHASLNLSTRTVDAGGPVTLSWSVVTPCQAFATITGPGFNGGMAGLDGSHTVTVPLQPGTATWRLTLTAPGNNHANLATESATVVIPGRPTVAVASHNDGRLEFLSITPDGAIHRRAQTSPGSAAMSPWLQSGTQLRSVVAEHSADQRVNVVAVGLDGRIWHRFQLVANTGTWSDWREVGGPAMLSLAIARGGDNRLRLFGASTAGELWENAELGVNGNTWGGWSRLSGTGLVALAAETNANGAIQLVGLTADNAIWTRWQAGGGWSEWTQLHGALATITLARNQDGRLELFGTDPWNNIWHRWQTGANAVNSWSEWAVFGGVLSSVAVERNADGRLELIGPSPFGTGPQRRSQNSPGGAWGAWVQVDGVSAAEGSTVSAPEDGALTAEANMVSTHWWDRSTNETGFQVQKRGLDGRWKVAHSIATRDSAGRDPGPNAFNSWVDMEWGISGQCYRFVAFTRNDMAASPERCTVRPDPDRFPQAVSNPAQQWSGYTSVNGDIGGLFNHNASDYLVYQDRDVAVELGWGNTGENWTFEAQGGPKLMKGQALALKLGSHGYLRFGTRTFGVDLQLSSEPSYEWYVIGNAGDINPAEGTALLSFNRTALWNSAARGYLVTGDMAWGIGLSWYRPGAEPDPPRPVPAPPMQMGIKQVKVLNCASTRNSVKVWLQDLTAGGGFTDKGTVTNHYGQSGGCPSGSPQPLTFDLVDGHNYLLVATDTGLPLCGTHDPIYGPCRATTLALRGGNSNGFVLTHTVGIGSVLGS